MIKIKYFTKPKKREVDRPGNDLKCSWLVKYNWEEFILKEKLLEKLKDFTMFQMKDTII